MSSTERVEQGTHRKQKQVISKSNQFRAILGFGVGA
eukprot:SAG11_NODE_20600_length_442_cov_0.702624_1_plen_35_part_10